MAEVKPVLVVEGFTMRKGWLVYQYHKDTHSILFGAWELVRLPVSLLTRR